MALQVDGKYRLEKKIGSGMAPFTKWTDGPESRPQGETLPED
jgi:hypothetical protein